MKACFVCARILPLFGIGSNTEFGGAEVQISRIARYLVKQGFDVDILVGMEEGPEPRVVDGVRLVPAIDDAPDKGASGKLKAKLGLFRAMRRSQAEVFVTSCADPDVGLVAMFAKVLGKSSVYRVAHDTDCDGTYERKNGWRGKLFGFGLRNAVGVVAQHADQAAALKLRGIDPVLIRNSFDLSAARSAESRDIDALWVGRCETWKRPFEFLEIARRLPGLRFTMICATKRGREKFMRELRAAAVEVPNLEFLDGVPFDEVQGYFERAKLLVGTSEAEGFPNTYIQASIAATPIAALEVDPDGFIEKSACGINAHGDLDRLIEGIGHLLTDKADWRTCSTNALSYAKRTHDLQVEGAKWAKLLASAEPRARPQRAAHAAQEMKLS